MESAGMVFAFIFVIIIIALLFAFALPLLLNLFDFSGKAQTQKAIENIKKITNQVYSYSEGSSRSLKLTIPTSAKICFINEANPEIQLYPGAESWKNWNPEKIVLDYMLKDSHSQNYGSNVWIYFNINNNKIGEGSKIKHLKTQKSFCSITGKTLYFENKGTYVEVNIS